MSRQVNEIIYCGKDNVFIVEYQKNGSIYDFTNTTKIEFILNDKSVNSDDNPEYFDYSTGTDGRIIFKLGAAGYLSEDTGNAEVIVYDASNTGGIVFSGKDGLTIKSTLHVKVCE